MGGLKKCLMEGSEGSFCAGFDVVRAYSGMLLSMETLPVLSRFDEFMEIVGPVLDDSFYLVENEVSSVRHNILMNRRYGLLQGYVLNRCGCAFRLIAELRPSRLASHCTGPSTSSRSRNSPSEPRLRNHFKIEPCGFSVCCLQIISKSNPEVSASSVTHSCPSRFFFLRRPSLPARCRSSRI